MHQQYPHAKLFGTRRHLDKFPGLPWQPERTESAAFAARFAEDLEFSVPKGVHFISDNERVHFSSVLAYHPASKTIHSDDTLMYFRLPGVLGKLKQPEVSFHPTLSKALQERAGATAEFRAWATELATRWSAARNLCAAHSAALSPAPHESPSIAAKILRALHDVDDTLAKHEETWG